MPRNRRATLTAVGEFTVSDVDLPLLSPNHVRLRVEAAGICGSDLHTFKGENPVIAIPIAPGHEFSGRVVEVGPGADLALVGRRVAARPSVPCGSCPPCRRGDEHLCDALKFVGSFVYEGAFAEYVDLPEACVIPASDLLTSAELVFAEPIACAVHAASLAGDLSGRHVLVIGCGTIGLLITKVALLAGAKVSVTDLVPAKISLAAALGAGAAIGTDSPQTSFRYEDGGEFDVAFDCVGRSATLDAAMRSLRKGGTAVLVGVPSSHLEIDPVRILVEERHLVGSFICRNADFAQAVELLETRTIDVRPFISGRYPLDRIGDAFAAAVADAVRVKLIIEP